MTLTSAEQRNGQHNGNGNGKHPPGQNGSRPGRQVPHDLQAEESLLGAMLLSREAVAVALEVTDAGHFYKPAWGHVFAAGAELYTAGEPVDPTTVADVLARHGLLELVGGPSALIRLQAGTPATSAAGKYARIVADMHILRRLIQAANEISGMGYDLPSDVGATLERAEAMVYELADSRRVQRADLSLLPESLGRWLDQLQAAYETGGTMGIPTGWHDVDQMLRGLHEGELVTIAARPSMGKSACALNLAVEVASTGRPVLFESIEMSEQELHNRLLASEARVDLQRIRSARLQESDWPKLSHAIGRLGSAPIVIADNPSATLLSIRSDARRVRARCGGLGVVVVDYLQLLASPHKAENRQVEVSELARGLKVLARDLKVPVVALAQLNRNLEQRGDKRPVLSDLRESGEIENSSDVVAFLYRDEVYNPDSSDRGTAEFIVAKQRNGPTGTARLAWLAHFGRFANMARM